MTEPRSMQAGHETAPSPSEAELMAAMVEEFQAREVSRILREAMLAILMRREMALHECGAAGRRAGR